MKMNSRLSKKEKIGGSSEMAQMAALELKKRGYARSIEIVSIPVKLESADMTGRLPDHQFVVMDRERYSRVTSGAHAEGVGAMSRDGLDIGRPDEGWSPDAVVIDPFAGAVYPADQFQPFWDHLSRQAREGETPSQPLRAELLYKL
ncbi:hypothetical protein FJU08_15620 [Martelella alba]|uniref:Uncharacterized protein n=1 Tax=Martelella alba TaxID=2590451 RepID=A0A506U6R6_9HYPH|nr:hypothetical protein [Martelella alba]TPW28764.1 hypothetical protein FJU08_15620 [Martelella alba]